MRPTHNHVMMRKPGMTLLELTVVILVLLSLIATLFVATRAWMRGSDRASCLMTSASVQKAVRAYQNLHQLKAGDPLVHTGTIVGPGCMLESEPKCPEYGAYQWEVTVPVLGFTYIDCYDPDNSSKYHYPQNIGDW